MIFGSKRKKIERIINQLAEFPVTPFKTELDRTLDDIENGNIPDDQPIVGGFTPRLIKAQDNWRHNPKVIHIILSVVMSECIITAMAIHGIKPHQFKRDLRHMANEKTEPMFLRLFREQVGNDVFEEYKAANPNEFR